MVGHGSRDHRIANYVSLYQRCVQALPCDSDGQLDRIYTNLYICFPLYVLLVRYHHDIVTHMRHDIVMHGERSMFREWHIYELSRWAQFHGCVSSSSWSARSGGERTSDCSIFAFDVGTQMCADIVAHETAMDLRIILRERIY